MKYKDQYDKNGLLREESLGEKGIVNNRQNIQVINDKKLTNTIFLNNFLFLFQFLCIDPASSGFIKNEKFIELYAPFNDYNEPNDT